MLIPTINGQEPAQAVLDGLSGRPQLVGLSDAQLEGAADVAQKLLSWFVTGVTWSSAKCKELQSMLATVPGGWSAITSALDLIPGTSFTPSGKDVHYWLLQANNQTCARLGFDLTKTPSAPAPTSTVDQTKLLTAIKTTIAPLVQTLQPTTPAAPTYPAGTIYARSSKQPGVYRIAVPRTTAGFGYAPDVSLVGAVPTLVGADATYTEVTPSTTVPSNGTPVTETDLEAKTGTLPLWKNWKFWAAVGGGVVVVGGLIALLTSNEKHQTIAQRSRAFERGDMRALGLDLDDDDEELGDDNYDDVIDVGEDQ